MEIARATWKNAVPGKISTFGTDMRFYGVHFCILKLMQILCILGPTILFGFGFTLAMLMAGAAKNHLSVRQVCLLLARLREYHHAIASLDHLIKTMLESERGLYRCSEDALTFFKGSSSWL